MMYEDPSELAQDLGPEKWFFIRRCDRVSDRLVLNDTRQWLRSVPYTSRPVLTAETYPRIVNELAALWQTPSSCRQYLTGLLQDTRGGRRGFPPLVHAELENLLMHLEAEVDVAIAKELRAMKFKKPKHT